MISATESVREASGSTLLEILLERLTPMATELFVHAIHQGGMRVLASTQNHQVLMDYPLQPDDAGEGLTPLQMLLASLAACSVNSVMVLLKKMNQPIAGLEVEARGLRQQEHPTLLTEISLEFQVKGSA